RGRLVVHAIPGSVMERLFRQFRGGLEPSSSASTLDVGAFGVRPPYDPFTGFRGFAVVPGARKAKSAVRNHDLDSLPFESVACWSRREPCGDWSGSACCLSRHV